MAEPISGAHQGTIEATLIARILIEVQALLWARSSPLATTTGLDSEFRRQAESILDEALLALKTGGFNPSPVSVEYGDRASMTNTGLLRATQNRHPADSLMAAEALFGVALPSWSRTHKQKPRAQP